LSWVEYSRLNWVTDESKSLNYFHRTHTQHATSIVLISFECKSNTYRRKITNRPYPTSSSNMSLSPHCTVAPPAFRLLSYKIQKIQIGTFSKLDIVVWKFSRVFRGYLSKMLRVQPGYYPCPTDWRASDPGATVACGAAQQRNSGRSALPVKAQLQAQRVRRVC
jgi:hypothetical protein